VYPDCDSITFLPKNSTFCSNSNGFISDTSIFTYCEKAKAFDAEVINVSTEYGQLAIQGPKARDLVQQFSVFPALTTKR
jgi:aminomethyltransferase